MEGWDQWFVGRQISQSRSEISNPQPKHVLIAVICRLLRIPLEGSNRTKALECLRTRGINDLTKDDIKLCYDAAREILSTIEKNVQSFFQQYCLPTSASNEDMARDSWRQDLSGHEPASKKRKRNMVDDSTRSPTSSNASEGLHSTPQEPSFERDLAALSADTAEVGCEKDSELEFLNRGMEVL